MLTVILIVLAVGLQTPAASHATDPHEGRFTAGLGVACAYCHDPTDWKSTSRPPFDMAARMSKMVASLNIGPLRPYGGVSCLTCHRGATKPARLPQASLESAAAKWPASLDLGEDAAKKRAREVYSDVQVLGAADAGSIKTSMVLYSASLGARCERCHAATGDWAAERKIKRTARVMQTMMAELPTYFDNTRTPVFQCFSCHQGATKPKR